VSRQFNPGVLFWFVIALLFVSSMLAMAAGNSVPSGRLGEQTSAINANALKPAACAALNLTRIVVCPAAGGSCSGTSASELILGSAFADTISAGGGNDCVVGGGGNDAINGGAGTDVCLGGPGTDTFRNCETQVQ
jgi:Ca2+-binding RTX toxin-like protein